MTPWGPPQRAHPADRQVLLRSASISSLSCTDTYPFSPRPRTEVDSSRHNLALVTSTMGGSCSTSLAAFRVAHRKAGSPCRSPGSTSSAAWIPLRGLSFSRSWTALLSRSPQGLKAGLQRCRKFRSRTRMPCSQPAWHYSSCSGGGRPSITALDGAALAGATARTGRPTTALARLAGTA